MLEIFELFFYFVLHVLRERLCFLKYQDLSILSASAVGGSSSSPFVLWCLLA